MSKFFYENNKERQGETCPRDKEKMTKLCCAKKGACCEFVSTSCNADLERRLLEMGFVPGEDITVMANNGSGSSGTVMVKVKSTKIALSNKIAENILVKEKEYE